MHDNNSAMMTGEYKTKGDQHGGEHCAVNVTRFDQKKVKKFDEHCGG